MMYRCNFCSAVFTEYNILYEGVETDLGTEVYTTHICPVCGCDDYEEVEPCVCGKAKSKDKVLCFDCRRFLKLKLANFAEFLTAEEEEQMDAWLDGNSIADWRKFE